MRFGFLYSADLVTGWKSSVLVTGTRLCREEGRSDRRSEELACAWGSWLPVTSGVCVEGTGSAGAEGEWDSAPQGKMWDTAPG